MTMLDRMRRHKNWLKWSLFLVVVTFIALYIPNITSPGAAGSSDVVATVDGRDITVARFRRVYQQQMLQFRQMYGANMDERMLRQLGMEQRIVQQMVDEEMALGEAQRLGITASDQEVRARILALPAFQENGHFIGDQRYQQILNMQVPPIRPSEFEEQVRRSIVMEKLRAALTHWLTVSEPDVLAEVKRRNEKVQLAVVNFPADKFREGVAPTDAEVAAHFEKNKDTYKVPEKRKIRYALIDLQAIRQRTNVTPQDIERYYQDNQQQYSQPEQVRASHILLETEGKDDAAVRKRAEELLAKAKAGADFAKLASENTDEEVGKKRGGDLDFFGRGAMVKEFEEAAFAQKPGELVDHVVKTQFGYHVIKVTDKREASTRPLDEVRPQVEEQLKSQRADDEMQRIVARVAPRIKAPGDLDTVAKPEGLTVSESGFFAREEPIAGLGMAPGVSDRAFEMKQGEVSEGIRTGQGTAFITVTGTQEARVPPLDEVKARVREDVIKQKAIEAARQKAASVASQAGSGDLVAAAKAAGLEAKTTEMLARGAAIPEVGVSPAVEAAAFSLPVNGVSQPIVTDNGAVIVKVVTKQEVSPDELTKGKVTVRDELLNEARNRFYGSYMSKVRDRLNQEQRIRLNPQTLAEVVG